MFAAHQMPSMNLRPTPDSLKALPLFGVLLACGIDFEGPQPQGFEMVAHNEVVVVCEQNAPCVPDELWRRDLLVSDAD